MDAHGHASTDASNTQFNAAAPGRMGAVGPRPGEPGSPTQANGAGTNRTQPHSHHVDNNSSQPQPPAHNHNHDHDHDHGRDHDHNHDHDHGHMADGIGSHRCPTAGGTGAFAGRSGEHAHTHEHLSTPGTFAGRELPVARRDFAERAFTVGVGGPVGSGKTALCLALCAYLRERHSLAVVTNDIFTREDCEFLQKNGALPAERIVAVETGGCPHAAVREDISSNLVAVEQLSARFAPEIVLVEAGGDNLAANFSRELADFIVYVIDVAGGDKIPRKGGPGITQSDLLVVNKTDLAGAVGADLGLMRTQAAQMRSYGPVVFAQVKHGVGVPEIAQMCVDAALALGAPVGKAGRRCDAPGGEPGGPEHKRPRVESGA